MKIVYKLTGVFVVIGLTIFVVGFFATRFIENTIKNNIADTSVVLTQETMNRIDKVIHLRTEEIRVYFEDVFLKEIIKKSNQEFAQMQNREEFIAQKDGEWTSAGKDTITPFIKEILNRPFSENMRLIIKNTELAFGYSVFQEIFVTNKYGVNIAQSRKTTDYYQADEEWWQKAKNEKMYISPIVFDKSIGKFGLEICMRIDDEDGNFLGIIKAFYSVDHFAEFLQDIKKETKHETLSIELLTREGRFIQGTEKHNFDESHSYQLEKILELGDDIKHKGWKLTKGHHGDSIKLISYAYSKGYQNYEGLGWILLMEYSADEIFDSVNRLTRKLDLLAFIASLFAIIFGIAISRYITKPLGILKKALLEVGKGDFGSKVLINTRDELEDLAESFNKMIDELRTTSISKEYFNNIIETMNEFLIVTHPDGKIATVNKAVSDKLGYDINELKGKDIRTLLSEDEIPFGSKQFKKLIKESHFTNYETSLKTKENLKIPVLISCAVMKNKDGVMTNVVCLAIDITEQKKAEESLKEVNKSLIANERALKNLMYDLKKANDDLKNTQSQLVQSEKLSSLGQLSAGIAHEINNPLGFLDNNIVVLEEYIDCYMKILKAVDVLKKAIEEKDLERATASLNELKGLEEKVNLDFISSDIENLIRESKGGTERIKNIIQDLKTFSRKDEGQMELNNIEEILEGVMNIVWNEIKYTAELKKEYGKIPLVKCNAQKLGQVFINLLVNATQALKEKGEIKIKTFVDGKHACIEIADTGSGIPQDTLDKIFDPFFTTKEVGKGTGLGLSISYDIIKQHKGDISVTSEVGKGTTFIIKLPLEDVKS